MRNVISGRIPDMTKKEIVANGNICPVCRAKIHRREYNSGLVTYQTHESPIHWQLVDEITKILKIKKSDEFSTMKKEGKLGNLEIDILCTVAGTYVHPTGEAYEIVVENDRNLEDRRKKLREYGYTLICVYPEDAIYGIDIEEIREREYPDSLNYSPTEWNEMYS
jgi:DNA-binding sugar fermentation-stimulating protein